MSNIRHLTLHDAREIFGIHADTSIDEIKKKYKKLAVAFHPDKNSQKDTTEKFCDIKAAYDLLLETKNKLKLIHPSQIIQKAANPIFWREINLKLKKAVEGNHLAEVSKWLDAGADPNVGWGCWFGPLEHAAKHGYLEIVRVLLQYGANPDASAYTDDYPHKETYTVLHWFASHGGPENMIEIVKLLLEFGANPNAIATPEFKDSILRDAARQSNYAKEEKNQIQLVIIKLLIQYGANLHFKDRNGETPLQIGIHSSHPAFKEFFRSIQIKEAVLTWLALLQCVRLGFSQNLPSDILQIIHSFMPTLFSEEERDKERIYFRKIVAKNESILSARRNSLFQPKQLNYPDSTKAQKRKHDDINDNDSETLQKIGLLK